MSWSGPLAEASLAGLNLDRVMIGVDGLTPAAGLTTHHEVEAHANQALIARAQTVTVVCDSSKLGAVAFARICDLTEVDEIITDSAASPAAVRELTDAGVNVTTV